jgi:hypothetical protein
MGGILVIGALLRVVGMGFGLPAVYNPDEVAIMNRAVALGQNGLNPHNFLYPTLYFYVLFGWEALLFAAGWVAGRFESLAAFEREFFLNPTIFYLAGRLLSALCGVATLWATWRFGTRLFGHTAGLAAATLLAVAPLAVRDAHYVKHDVPVTLLIVLTHLALSTPHPRRWWLTGIAAGLSMSTHYYAVFVLVPVILLMGAPSAAGEAWTPRVRRVMATLAVAAAAFFAASPFLLVEPATAFRDIVANRQIVVDRATSTGGAFASLRFYLEWLAADAAGATTAVLALAGGGIAWRAGYRRAVATLAFPVAFLLFMANTVPASRYLNPVLPFVAILAGAAVAWVWSRGRPWQWVAAGVLLGASLEAGAASALNDRFFTREDTRTLARAWIETHLPQGASVLVQPYSVPLTPSRAGLEEALTHHLGSPDRASIKFQRQLALDPYPSPAYRTIFLGTGGLDVDKIYVDPASFRDEGLAPLRRLAVTHVVMKRYNDEDPAMTPLVLALEQEGRLDITFSPYRIDIDPSRRRRTEPFQHNTDTRIDRALERPGPIIDIWTIN